MSNEAEGPKQLQTLFLYAATSEGKASFILSAKCFELLKKGNIVVSPDGSVVLSYSHDIEESSHQMDAMVSCTGVVDKELLGFIIREGARPPKKKGKINDKQGST